MIQIILSVVFLGFGIFLKLTDHPGFRSSKRFSVLFIILGTLTLTAKLILIYLASKQ
ncbi:hypothetical protein J2780_003427 [Chryseobacterium camelliae]|nr:hypothetical protein [Chryseobacterium camelliae]